MCQFMQEKLDFKNAHFFPREGVRENQAWVGNGELEMGQMKPKGKPKLHLKPKLKSWRLEECVCLRIFLSGSFP